MTKVYSKWVRELTKVHKWEPKEEETDLNPEVDINMTKINHITKRWLVENGHEKWCNKQGFTAYNMAKTHPTGNNIMLLTGVSTFEEYKEAAEQGVGESKWFRLIGDSDVEKAIKQCRKAATIIAECAKTPAEIEFGSLGSFELPDEASLTAINALLKDSTLPYMEDMFQEFRELEDSLKSKDVEVLKSNNEIKDKEKELERLKKEVTTLMAASASNVNVEYNDEREDIPDGKVVTRPASEMFPIKLENDFDIPTWEWEHDHPDVPEKDPNYIFRPQHLQRALYAILTNQREYIQGHTGSGKTTLIEQIAAHLNWPFIRINFDSEITRMDLIGRDTLVSDKDGNVTSKFEDGMLPTAMSGPYICCFDELDFVRPDVAYVMQAALEGNGLRITEDGDRLVRPHPMFRMFGTGNTVGQGDEHGMYQGARPQSMAFLDRFTVWDKVDYLSSEERKDLVRRKYPALDEKTAKQILQYTTEHLEAFTQGKVIQPISPRGMLAICQATIMLGSVKDALGMTVLDRANVEDRATLKGLVDRVSK